MYLFHLHISLHQGINAKMFLHIEFKIFIALNRDHFTAVTAAGIYNKQADGVFLTIFQERYYRVYLFLVL